jgi:hypothetical protein
MGWKSVRKGTNGVCRASEQEKRRADWKGGLVNLWSRKKINKKAHAGRGQEIKWKIPDQMGNPE